MRYLEKAVQGLAVGQLKLVFEALHERAVVMGMAPHLTSALPIMMPCYHWWEVPYFWLGMKVRGRRGGRPRRRRRARRGHDG